MGSDSEKTDLRRENDSDKSKVVSKKSMMGMKGKDGLRSAEPGCSISNGNEKARNNGTDVDGDVGVVIRQDSRKKRSRNKSDMQEPLKNGEQLPGQADPNESVVKMKKKKKKKRRKSAEEDPGLDAIQEVAMPGDTDIGIRFDSGEERSRNGSKKQELLKNRKTRERKNHEQLPGQADPNECVVKVKEQSPGQADPDESSVKKTKKRRKRAEEDLESERSREVAMPGDADVGKHESLKNKRTRKRKSGEKLPEQADLDFDPSVAKKMKRKRKRSEESQEAAVLKKGEKRVRFAEGVEIRRIGTEEEPESGQKNLWGVRFTREEDEILLEAINKYVETKQLGENGLKMVLNCQNHPEVKGCWNEIATCLPNRHRNSIYYRAHSMLERRLGTPWSREDIDAVRKLYEQHGSNWKLMADKLGKYRRDIKDVWRHHIRLPNKKSGVWLQEEYQRLFDLVNLDFCLKASCDGRSERRQRRDNIAWEAISGKLSTRSQDACCVKWYSQLTSSLVRDGEWADSDDYRLLEALQDVDVTCVEEVDWDELLEHRPGEVCRKRWDQMVRYIGGYKERPFLEQVELLSQRYRPEMLEYRK